VRFDLRFAHLLLTYLITFAEKRTNVQCVKNGSVPGFSLFGDAAYRLSLSTDNSTNDVTRYQYP